MKNECVHFFGGTLPRKPQPYMLDVIHGKKKMIDESGITNSAGLKIAWSDLVCVSGHKIDAMTHVVTYLTFDHQCGEYLELVSGDSSFNTVVENLHKYLDIPKDWFSEIAGASVGDGIIEVWKKQG